MVLFMTAFPQMKWFGYVLLPMIGTGFASACSAPLCSRHTFLTALHAKVGTRAAAPCGGNRTSECAQPRAVACTTAWAVVNKLNEDTRLHGIGAAILGAAINLLPAVVPAFFSEDKARAAPAGPLIGRAFGLAYIASLPVTTAVPHSRDLGPRARVSHELP